VRAVDRLLAASLPIVPRPVVRKIADRYIAGESLTDAVATVRALNDRGAMATVDVLGEFIRNPGEAEATATEYERVLDAIAAGQLDANVSGQALGPWDRDRPRPGRPHARTRCFARPSGTASSCASTWSTVV